MAADTGRVAPPPDSREHAECLSYAMSCVHAGEGLLDQYIPEWQENYRALMALPSRRNRVRRPSWQSGVRIPYIAEQIFTLLPRLVDNNFSVDLIPQQYGTPRASLRAGEKVISHTLWRDNFVTKQAQLMLINAFVGYSWAKTSWLFEERQRTVRSTSQQIAMGMPPTYEKTLRINDRATNTVLHPFDALHDPKAQVLEGASFVAHRYFDTVENVRRKARQAMPDGSVRGIYDNTDLLKEGIRQRQQELPEEVPTWVTQRVKGDKECEIIEVWSRSRDRLYTIANRELVLRDVRNPFHHCDLPFSCAITQPDVLRLKGISEVELLRSMQQMLWLLENQKLDNTRLNMDMVLLIRDTVENFDEFLIEPGAKWPVQNPSSDVQALQLPQPQLASAQDIESLRGRLQAMVGMTYLSGADPGAMGVNQNTASGLMAIQEESNRRVDFRLGLVRELCYTRIADQVLALTQQFMDDPLHLPLLGRDSEVIAITPDLIAPKAWARSRALTDTLSKSLKQQNANTMLAAMSGAIGTPIPTAQGPKMVTIEPILELLAESIDRDVNDFLTDLPPAEASAPVPTLGGAETAPPNVGAPYGATGQLESPAVY
jgi:hypothetical protein